MHRFPQLTATQRAAVARVAGAVVWLTVGPGRDVDVTVAVEQLHGESRDPVVLGHVLGGYLVRADADAAYHAPAIELLRAAGADEQAAEAQAAWLHERYPNGLV